MDAATYARILAAHAETKEVCRRLLEDIGGDVEKFMQLLDNVREREREEGRKEGIETVRRVLGRL